MGQALGQGRDKCPECGRKSAPVRTAKYGMQPALCDKCVQYKIDTYGYDNGWGEAGGIARIEDL